MSSVERTEIAVVGAGPSGATTALLLARAGHAVTVFDRARFPRDKACGEGLMPPGVRVLRDLDLLVPVLDTGAQQLHGVEYTHPEGWPTAYAPFGPPPLGGEPWGLGVRRTTFDEVLVDALRREALVAIHEDEGVTGLLRDAEGRIVGVTTARRELRADVVVAADGLHSRVRRWAGLSTPSRANGRYGLAGHWHLDVRERRAIVVTRAGDHEWYQAPVGPETLLVSVLANRQKLGRIAAVYETAAREAVPALEDAELVAGPLAAGQFRQRARTVARDGLFLAGDAAGYDDPTTGEGLAIGLQLAQKLAAHIGQLLRRDISADTAARRYRLDHMQLWRDRRRVISLALLMARTPWLSRRAVARAAEDPSTLSKLLAINCGYQSFRDLSPRDWLALTGF